MQNQTNDTASNGRTSNYHRLRDLAHSRKPEPESTTDIHLDIGKGLLEGQDAPETSGGLNLVSSKSTQRINDTARDLDSDQGCQTPEKRTDNQERLKRVQQAEESDEDDEDSDESANDDMELAQELEAKAEDSEEDELQGLDKFQLARLKRKKEEEEKQVKEFAQKNGFTIQNPSLNKAQTLYERLDALENMTFTKEQLEQTKKQRILENMLPQALEILPRKYTNKEPARTGFNQGLLIVDLKNNYEAKRSAQGPSIVVSNNNVKLKERSNSRETSRQSMRNKSRDNSMARGSESQMSIKRPFSQQGEQEDDDKETVHIVQQQNHETSLRHFFYLEYKKKFEEGKMNPIVYSRFGKQHYASDEQFDTENFNQLIRTCNLKKLLKVVEQSKVRHVDRFGVPIPNKAKFSEPATMPMGDYYNPRTEKDTTLVFESRFESGNLQLAHKQSNAEYDLILQNDVNSKGHTQWFYFRVGNTRKGLKVKFNMLNMIKSKSLYNDGMKVLVYSTRRQEDAESLKGLTDDERAEMKGWHRGGEDLHYYQNRYRKDNNQGYVQSFQQRCFYTFSFSHTFENDFDQVYFAYSVPYTYTMLTDHLCEIQSKQMSHVTRNTLCRSIAGNKCEYLTITNRLNYQADRKKQGVVITGRIHPGETNSSWMMKGVIDFLISEDEEAKTLRDNYVFKIIPMLNPDGVINGNYRCSLAGCDLNRRWKFPSEALHPTVFFTKKLINGLAQERPLALYADLHGHSRRKNIFMYGNLDYENENATKVFPFLMSKIAQPNFSYDYSRFQISRNKEHTARVAVWRDLNSKFNNIFTMEASFCGPKPVKFEPHRKKQTYTSQLNYHFITEDYANVGKQLCQTLTLYKEAEESSLGLSNVEYAVEQYHLDKEAKLKQEELFKQQMALIEQRKAQEAANRERSTASAMATEQPEARTDSTMKKRPEKDGKKSTMKKAKTDIESVATDTEQKDNEEEKEAKAEESEDLSDSEPSDDNLEEDQILALIPKKFGKRKFLKGVEETVKKKKKIKKPKEKKTETELMPCLQSKRKQILENRQKEEAEKTAEKPKPVPRRAPMTISKPVLRQMRNGLQVRDVATHIKYIGNGTNLSLMEIDILNHTGCRWSKVIYPGYKGAKSDFRSERASIHDASSITPMNKGMSGKFSYNFNSDIAKTDGDALRSNSKRNATMNRLTDEPKDPKAFSAKKESLTLGHNFGDLLNTEPKVKPFSLTDAPTDSKLKDLQQRIMSTNFKEPRSLIGGLVPPQTKKQLRRHNAFDYGKPDMAVKATAKFNLELETVHEKVNDKKSSIDLFAGDNEKSRRNLSKFAGSEAKIKQLINGNIHIKGQSGIKAGLSDLLGFSAGNKRGNSVGSANGQKSLEAKSSFTSVGKQIMSSDSKKQAVETDMRSSYKLIKKGSIGTRNTDNSGMTAQQLIRQSRKLTQNIEIMKNSN